MDKTQRQQLILVVILILLVGYFGYNGIGAFPGVSGWRAEAAKLRRDRDDLRQQVENAQGLVANLGRIRKEREALEVQLRELSRRLPSEAESAQVLRSVETLAGKSGLTVSQVRRQPNRSQELYVEVPMEVLVRGGYRDLIKFSEQLSQLPRLVNINQMTVQTPKPEPGAPPGPLSGVSAQLVTMVFQALPEPGSPAAGAKPGPKP